jgi:hypothetical protein
LWRGFEQITSTTPRRRMTRHRSHIGFTDARTFTRLSRPYLGRIVQKARKPHESGKQARNAPQPRLKRDREW